MHATALQELRLLLVEDGRRYQEQFKKVFDSLRFDGVELILSVNTNRALDVLATNNNFGFVVVVDQCLVGDPNLGDVVAKYCAERGIPYIRWSCSRERDLYHVKAKFCLNKPCGDRELRKAIAQLLNRKPEPKFGLWKLLFWFRSLAT